MESVVVLAFDNLTDLVNEEGIYLLYGDTTDKLLLSLSFRGYIINDLYIPFYLYGASSSVFKCDSIFSAFFSIWFYFFSLSFLSLLLLFRLGWSVSLALLDDDKTREGVGLIYKWLESNPETDGIDGKSKLYPSNLAILRAEIDLLWLFFKLVVVENAMVVGKVVWDSF